MGTWKRDGNHFPPNNKLVKEPEGNVENGYSVSDSNKTKGNYDKEHNKGHKNTLKEDILQVINENHRDHTQYSQRKCPGGTQEIPRQQK
jgi:hypothetical protein